MSGGTKMVGNPTSKFNYLTKKVTDCVIPRMLYYSQRPFKLCNAFIGNSFASLRVPCSSNVLPRSVIDINVSTYSSDQIPLTGGTSEMHHSNNSSTCFLTEK
jgi:hypothetical protein